VSAARKVVPNKAARAKLRGKRKQPEPVDEAPQLDVFGCRM